MRSRFNGTREGQKAAQEHCAGFDSKWILNYFVHIFALRKFHHQKKRISRQISPVMDRVQCRSPKYLNNHPALQVTAAHCCLKQHALIWKLLAKSLQRCTYISSPSCLCCVLSSFTFCRYMENCMFCTYDATCRAFIVVLFLVSLRSSFPSCLSKQSRQMAALPESASTGDVLLLKGSFCS